MQRRTYRPGTSVGKIIERAREEEGFGLRELARASGVSAGQISRIIAGKTSQPSVETLVRLAGALERDVDALLVLAESPEAFSGPRLDAARTRVLEAIATLPPADRSALADDERDLRRQIDEGARLEREIQRLEARLVDSHASLLTGSGESEPLENELRSLRGERSALDATFAGAVRAAAARLFSDVRGRTSALNSTSSPAWHTQPRAARRETVAPRFSVRPLAEMLPQPQSLPKEGVRSSNRQEPTTDREVRHLLRAWEQLTPTRRRRVAEFIDDQHRLSLHEQLSQDANEESKEEQ